MARNVQHPADETVTVRLPYGTAQKVRAATGQPFSRIVRFMVTALLNKHAAEGGDNKMLEAQSLVENTVKENEL